MKQDKLIQRIFEQNMKNNCNEDFMQIAIFFKNIFGLNYCLGHYQRLIMTNYKQRQQMTLLAIIIFRTSQDCYIVKADSFSFLHYNLQSFVNSQYFMFGKSKYKIQDISGKSFLFLHFSLMNKKEFIKNMQIDFFLSPFTTIYASIFEITLNLQKWFDQLILGYFGPIILKKMRRILCLALLLALTCQLQLASHLVTNPLAGKSFTIFHNSLGDNRLNGMKLSFSSTSISYNSACGEGSNSYSVKPNSEITISGGTTRTSARCLQIETDNHLQWLLIHSTKYNFNGSLMLLDPSGKVLLGCKPA